MRVEVKTGESLAALLRTYPDARVTSLITEPGQDAWGVDLDPEYLREVAREEAAMRRPSLDLQTGALGPGGSGPAPGS